MSSKQGVVQKFISEMKYSDAFRGLLPATPQFNKKWVELAGKEQFAKDQHEFIKRTHFDVQIKHLKENGIDLGKRGCAVQDCIWSTAVQFGPNTNLIIKALKGQNAQTDKDIVTAIQNYKIRNNDLLFKSSSAQTRESTLQRAKSELNSLLALCNESPEPESTIISTLGQFFDSISN